MREHAHLKVCINRSGIDNYAIMFMWMRLLMCDAIIKNWLSRQHFMYTSICLMASWPTVRPNSTWCMDSVFSHNNGYHHLKYRFVILMNIYPLRHSVSFYPTLLFFPLNHLKRWEAYLKLLNSHRYKSYTKYIFSQHLTNVQCYYCSLFGFRM